MGSRTPRGSKFKREQVAASSSPRVEQSAVVRPAQTPALAAIPGSAAWHWDAGPQQKRRSWCVDLDVQPFGYPTRQVRQLKSHDVPADRKSVMDSAAIMLIGVDEGGWCEFGGSNSLVNCTPKPSRPSFRAYCVCACSRSGEAAPLQGVSRVLARIIVLPTDKTTAAAADTCIAAPMSQQLPRSGGRSQLEAAHVQKLR